MRAGSVLVGSMVDERVAALMARGIAPIKPQYLCAAADAHVAVPPLPSDEKSPEGTQRKSKNQLKRVSRQRRQRLVADILTCLLAFFRTASVLCQMHHSEVNEHRTISGVWQALAQSSARGMAALSCHISERSLGVLAWCCAALLVQLQVCLCPQVC